MFSDIAAARKLAWRLALRDIRSQYRQTFLGLIWAFVTPLASTLAWIFLSTSGIINVSRTELPYPIYVFIGTMLWSIFVDSFNAPMNQVNSARGMLTKLNFPRESIIISGIYQVLFNASIKITLVLSTLIFIGIDFDTGLALFPIGIAALVLTGTALGLLIVPMGMLYSDIGRGMGLIMQLAMYITPAIFPFPQEGIAKTLFTLNPISPLIMTTRDWLTGQTPAMLGYFIGVTLFASLLLMISWGIYRLAMPILIERMGG